MTRITCTQNETDSMQLDAIVEIVFVVVLLRIAMAVIVLAFVVRDCCKYAFV